MLFIALLIFAATTIAGSAAFFSVYGLAYTFSGTFWSVVVMGSSLEVGKLVTASYLYRYWQKTHIALKAYLMAGVLALMILTSTGIFGYLSTGYQADVLPLKQATEQVKLLDEEKARLLERKKQIDNQIASLPTNSVKGRTTLMKGFKDEQISVTNRLTALDTENLALKQKLIQTEAHIGPITYIAKAFGLESDNATKYLIYLIIFAFDPMAVALTLCVNIAQRYRREELEEERLKKLAQATEVVVPMPPPPINVEPVVQKSPLPPYDTAPAEDILTKIRARRAELAQVVAEPVAEFVPVDEVVDEGFELMSADGDEILDPHEEEQGVATINPDQMPIDFDAPAPEPVVVEEVVEPVVEPVVAEPEIVEEVVEPVELPSPPVLDLPPPQQRHLRPYPGLWNTGDTDSRVGELVAHLKWLKERQHTGEPLSKDEMWELRAIEDVLKKHGYNIYI